MNATTHAEVFELIPWYVNGTLKALEQDAVQRHVAECETCAEEVRWLGQVCEVRNTSAEVCPLPGPALAQVMARIDRDERDTSPASSAHSPGWLATRARACGQWLATLLARPAVWAAAPAALVVAVFVFVQGNAPLPPDRATELTTLTRPGTALRTTTLSVRPATDAAHQAVRDALAGTGADGELQPGAADELRLVLPADTDLDAVKRLLLALKSSHAITSASLTLD